MDSVLIVSSSDKVRVLLSELLKIEGMNNIIVVASGSEARRLLVQTNYELVVIDSPLSDEFGHELGVRIASSTSSGVMLMVKQELTDAVSAKVEDYGVFVVEKPTSKLLFHQALKLIYASRRRVLGLKNENLQLQKKIEEIKIVDRAKCVLIQYLNMDETEAHKYIEHQAMDLRLTRRKIAENILKTYES